MIPLIFLAQFYGVWQLLLLGSLSRTTRWTTLLLAFFAGIAISSPLTLLFQLGWTHLYAAASHQPEFVVANLASYTLDPLIEEIVKVLPLLLVCLVPRVRRQLGLADFVLLSLALGSGFGLTEDLLRFSYFGHTTPIATHGDWLFPFGLNLVQIPGLTHMLTSWIPAGTTIVDLSVNYHLDTNFHLAASSLVGLAAGLLIKPRMFRQGNLLKTSLVKLAALGLFTLSVCVHMAHNTPFSETLDNPFWKNFVALFSQGIEQHSLALFPLLAIVIAVILDRRLLARVGATSPELLLPTEKRNPANPFALLEFLSQRPRLTFHLWNYVLQRRAYLFNLTHIPGDTTLVRQSGALITLRRGLERQRPPASRGLLALLLAWRRNTQAQLNSVRHPDASETSPSSLAHSSTLTGQNISMMDLSRQRTMPLVSSGEPSSIRQPPDEFATHPRPLAPTNQTPPAVFFARPGQSTPAYTNTGSDQPSDIDRLPTAVLSVPASSTRYRRPYASKTSTAHRQMRLWQLISLVLLSLLLTLPTLLYFCIGSIPGLGGIQTWLGNPVIFILLKLLLIVGILRLLLSLFLKTRKLPKLLKRANGQALLVNLLGIEMTIGSLGTAISTTFVSLLTTQGPLQTALPGHILSALAAALLLSLLAIALLALLLASGPEILALLGELLADETGALRIGIDVERSFASEGLLEQHFADHGAKFGLETAEDYLAAANQFFEGGEGVETFEFANGDVGFYNEATNEFGVLNENGAIKTYFPPDEGLDYWLQVIGKL